MAMEKKTREQLGYIVYGREGSEETKKWLNVYIKLPTSVALGAGA